MRFSRSKGSKDTVVPTDNPRDRGKIWLFLSMKLLQWCSLAISLLSVLLMIAGFFKPWLLLWWKDIQRRRDVIKYYGTLAGISYFVYWLLIIIANEN
jgi:hypothetical protein